MCSLNSLKKMVLLNIRIRASVRRNECCATGTRDSNGRLENLTIQCLV